MEKTNKRCSMCRNFDRYYTKGIKRFNKVKAGWCCVKSWHVSSFELCDKFETKTAGRIYKRGIAHSLNGLLTEISEIRKIIAEEYCESNENEQL